MRSLGKQIELLSGLVGTKDVSEWESNFIESVEKHKSDTSRLTEKQVEIIERLHNQHFA
jgi:hypothetical protein